MMNTVTLKNKASLCIKEGKNSVHCKWGQVGSLELIALVQFVLPLTLSSMRYSTSICCRLKTEILSKLFGIHYFVLFNTKLSITFIFFTITSLYTDM